MARRTGINVYLDIVIPKIEEIKTWRACGYSLNKIAEKLEIRPSTLYGYLQDETKIELKNAFTYDGLANLNVQTALYQMATGYVKILRKAFKLKTVSYDEKGRKVEKEEIRYAEEEFYFPPEFPAIKYWLATHWGDKYKSEPGNENEINGLLATADDIVAKIRDMAETFGEQKAGESHA